MGDFEFLWSYNVIVNVIEIVSLFLVILSLYLNLFRYICEVILNDYDVRLGYMLC